MNIEDAIKELKERYWYAEYIESDFVDGVNKDVVWYLIGLLNSIYH